MPRSRPLFINTSARNFECSSSIATVRGYLMEYMSIQQPEQAVETSLDQDQCLLGNVLPHLGFSLFGNLLSIPEVDFTFIPSSEYLALPFYIPNTSALTRWSWSSNGYTYAHIYVAIPPRDQNLEQHIISLVMSLIHECLHALFSLYACHCRQCIVDVFATSGWIGHGAPFLRSAFAIEMTFGAALGCKVRLMGKECLSDDLKRANVPVAQVQVVRSEEVGFDCKALLYDIQQQRGW